jgi:hypothetical protein
MSRIHFDDYTCPIYINQFWFSIYTARYWYSFKELIKSEEYEER